MPFANQTPVGQSRITNSGIVSTAGLDANSNARGTSAVGTLSTVGKWRLMEQTCPAVAIGSRVLLGVLNDVQFDTEAHEDCPEKIVEYIRAALFEVPVKNFSEYAEALFNSVRYGFAPQEIVLRKEKGFIWLHDLCPRPPNTFDLHTCQRLPSGWTKARQRFYADAGQQSFADYGEPGEEGKGILLWPTFGDNGGIFGEGFYRPLYAIFEEWQSAVRYRRIATQKAGLGTFVIFQKENQSVDDGVMAATEQAVANATTHERGALTMPPWVDPANSDWKFSNPSAIEALTGVINDCETRILQSFGAQYAARGITSDHGSFSASKVDVDELGTHRNAFVNGWLPRVVQPLIKFLVDLNFGPQKYYPRLTGGTPREISPSELVNAMVSATSAGLLVVDSGVRGNVRKALQQDPEGDEALSIIDEPVEPVIEEPTEPVIEQEDAELTACNCAEHFAAGDTGGATEGVRAAPKFGGQDRITGPNGRDLSDIERLVRWPVIKMTLDSGEATIKALLVSGREDVARDLMGTLKNAKWETANEAAEILRKAKVKGSIVKGISKRVIREIQRIGEMAADTVEQEASRQGVEGVESFAAGWEGDDGWGQGTANQAADEALNDTRAQLVRAAISIEAPTRAEVMELLTQASEELFDTMAGNTATLVATETFARARDAHVKKIATETSKQPKAVWYSAILDDNTCGPCETADTEHGQLTGEAIPWGGPLHTEMLPPYQRCLGGVRCRCQLIYEWS